MIFRQALHQLRIAFELLLHISVAGGPHAHPARSLPPTEMEILGDPGYHHVPLISHARKNLGYNTINYGRVDGSVNRHPADSDMAHEIRSRTLADQFTFWGQYLIAVGFYPSKTVEDTLRDLYYTVGRIGIDVDSHDYQPQYPNSLLVDEDWVKSNYESYHWEVTRNHTGTAGGFLIKLERPALFGNFLMTTAFYGTIAPMSSIAKSAEHRKRVYLFMAIPAHVPMKAIQLAARYPPILAVRSIPIGKDRNALTNAALGTLYNILTRVIPGQFAIIPVQQYHQVIVSSQKRRQFLHYTHPDLDEETRALPDEDRSSARDTIWEVILVLADSNVDGMSSEDRAQECHKKVFEELAKSRNGSHELTPPFLANAGGFQYEYMTSAEQFLSSPRGPANITVPSGVRIFGIPDNMLAADALNILAQDTTNHDAINRIRGAIVAPRVPSCIHQNFWRLFLLGDITMEDLNVGPLDEHMSQHRPNDPATHMSEGPIEGVEEYTKLRAMYEYYFSRQE